MESESTSNLKQRKSRKEFTFEFEVEVVLQDFLALLFHVSLSFSTKVTLFSFIFGCEIVLCLLCSFGMTKAGFQFTASGV